MLTFFQHLATSGRHNSAMTTSTEIQYIPNQSSTGCPVSIFTVGINSNSFCWPLDSVHGT